MAAEQTINATVESVDNVNILMRYPYEGVPMTIAAATFATENGVVKAGTPISVDGAIANNASAAGILLNDVYPEMPVGTIVKKGYINALVAQEHSGITYSLEALKTALPMVVFEGASDQA